MSVRQGECRCCGRCCVIGWRFIYLAQKLADGGVGAVEGLERIKPPEPKEPACDQLVFEPETGRAVCLQYDGVRNPLCVIFPTSPREIEELPGCGFSFSA